MIASVTCCRSAHTSASKYSMETWTGFCTRSIIDDILFHFTGDTHRNSSVIKVNCENLLANGELYFLCNVKAWRGLVACSNSCTNILQHLAHAHGATKGNTDADAAEEVIDIINVDCLCYNWLILT